MLVSKHFPGTIASMPVDQHLRSTSELMQSGLVVHMIYRGVPSLSPMGSRVLQSVESTLLAAAEGLGFAHIRLPGLVAREDLEGGEPVGEVFESKMIKLAPPLDSYHMLSTPEMLLVKIAGLQQLGHSNLPCRYAYTEDFFRNVPTTRSFLTCRQFRIFGLLSLEPGPDHITAVLKEIEQFTETALAHLGICVRSTPHAAAQGFETFFTPEASEVGQADRPSIADGRLSLAMGYHYAASQRLGLRYRTRENRNAPVQAATYGMSLLRVLYSHFHAYRDAQGFALPQSTRPFHVAILPYGPGEMKSAAELYHRARTRGLKPLLDDRTARPARSRTDFAALVGAPLAILLRGEGAEVWRLRGRGEKRRCSVEAVLSIVAGELAADARPKSV